MDDRCTIRAVYLSEFIHFEQLARPKSVHLRVHAGSVPIEVLDSFDKILRTSLKRKMEDGFDMARMRTIIIRDRLRVSMFLTSKTSHSCY